MKDIQARRERGESHVALAAERSFADIHPDDRWSIASDAVSDILTAVVGPAGGCVPQDGLAEIVYDREAIREAGRFLAFSLRSWKGDAEDYMLSGNPGVAS